MNQVLEDKVAIVTGASSGIGLATTKAFLAAGASVLGVDLSPAPSAVQNAKFKFHQVNITETNAPQTVVLACKSAFGGSIDILINNAGIMDLNAGVETLRDEDWDRVMAVNLTAPVKIMREVVKVMKEQKSGSIVNVSSKAGISGAAAGVAYTSSKHGLIGATKNTAWLYKDDGIRCNAICPGAVATNIAQSVDQSKVDFGAFAKLRPVLTTHVNLETGEGAASPDVAVQAMLFLASDLSKGITGIVLPVDNGWSVI